MLTTHLFEGINWVGGGGESLYCEVQVEEVWIKFINNKLVYLCINFNKAKYYT